MHLNYQITEYKHRDILSRCYKTTTANFHCSVEEFLAIKDARVFTFNGLQYAWIDWCDNQLKAVLIEYNS